MVAISLSVRALVLTVLTLASAVKITHPVEDYALVFTRPEEDLIARRLLTLASRTNAQMAVLTVKSLGGQKIEVFSRRVASSWGGGSRRRNDGLLLVIAPKDRRIRLEVGAGLADKLTDDRVQRILDDAGPMLKLQSYQTAVIDIVDGIEPILLGRGPLLGGSRTPLGVAVGALATAAGVKVAQNALNSSAKNRDVLPAGRDRTAMAHPGLPLPEGQFANQTELDSFLMRRYFLLLSLASLILGAVFGRARLRQDPSAIIGLFSYAVMVGVALAVSWFVSVSLGSPQLSPAIVVITLTQAISGMRVGMSTHEKRIVGPDDDFELIERAPAREAARYALPGIIATIILGVILKLPFVSSEEFLAMLGAVMIAVGHAIALSRLHEQIAGRPSPPSGSGERICTSSYGRTNADGVHVHERDDSNTNQYDTNDTDNRGGGGTFNGNGASSRW